MQVDPSELHEYGITSKGDIGNLRELIQQLRIGSGAPDDEFEYEPEPHYGARFASSATFSGGMRRKGDVDGYGEGDGGMYGRGRDGAHGVGGGIPRPGGKGRSQGRRPSSIYGVPHAPSNGIPRASPAASFSPPMQPTHQGSSVPSMATNDSRTAGRGGLPPPGNPGASRISRRQTLAPTSYGLGISRGGDGGSRTMAARPGGGRGSLAGARGGQSNMSEILERSNALTRSQQVGMDSDDDLERVVRKSGQSSLVNAYGIPIRPTTGHVKRSASERRSLAGGGGAGLRPKTSHRGIRGDSSFGLAPVKETPSNLNDKIRVCVRKRPLNRAERERSEKDIVHATGQRSLSVMEPKQKVDLTKYIEESRFTFDEVFDEHATNVELYERTAKPLVEFVFRGRNATCFAYGQTGSGKTFTMMDKHDGLYIQAAQDVFALLNQPQNQHLQAFVMFFEIYLTNLFDLLNDRKKMFAREDAKQNVVIQGGRSILIQSPEDLMEVFEFGNNCRSTGSTGANADSSRSHAILQIELKDMSKRRPTTHGKLSFIDLAGNERGADRGDKADKQTIMEGSEINKSLLSLKECIRALDLNKKHQPFRQSKLTQVLKDSFIGNSRACMVATISPNTANSDNTLNTLRYADRVKAMKTMGGGGDGGQAASDEYAAAELDDPTYEDDSHTRMQEEDTAYGWDDAPRRGLASFGSSSHDALREEDEYAEDVAGEDEFAMPGAMYQQRQPQREPPMHEYEAHGSFDEAPIDEAPSIMDEQPAFLDDVKEPLRSPRAYGSPAAKKFVASRMARSPTGSKKLRAPSQLAGGSRLPALGRSNSVSFEPTPLSPEIPMSPPPPQNRDLRHPGHAGAARGTRSRGNTHSGGAYEPPKQRVPPDSGSSIVPCSSGTSDPSDSNASPEYGSTGPQGADDGPSEPNVDTLVAPFVGLNMGDVEALVKQNRAEIRVTTEACKEETALLSAYHALSYANLVQSQARARDDGNGAGHGRQSSWQQQQGQALAEKYRLDVSTGAVTRLTDGERFESVDRAKVSEAIEYLEKLDDVLAKKQQAIVDLRESIRCLVWSTDLAN
ncbi:hypothetical protein GGF46_005148 [Coemansia sp. RSA 552]|nr:hypothetical protein GGF46_005148 [Coemansia sp. RSA 552]